MPDAVSLIITSEPVKRVTLTPGLGRGPSVAVVYATRDGDLEVLDGGKPMRWSDQLLTRYRMRYEIDISDHHTTVEFKDNTALPTHADVYHFHATVSASFRVTDPAEVVRRNVTDAIPLVHGHLLGVCRPITRMFTIEEAESAEAEIHSRFRRDILIQGGITLYAVEVRLSLDEAGRKFLHEVEQAARDERIKAAQHVVNVNDVNRKGQIDVLTQAGDHLLQDRERLVLESMSLEDPAALIRLHLQRNPGDTAGAAKMAAELEAQRMKHETAETDRWQNVLSTMASSGLLQPTDLDPLRDAILGRLSGSAGTLRVGATAGTPVRQTPPAQGTSPPPPAIGWDDPLTPSAPAVPAQASEPAVTPPAPAAPQGPRGEPASCLPVYVVIDESADAASLLDDLNTAVEDLFEALRNQHDAAAALRIAVFGFAETVKMRVPLGTVAEAPKVGKLTTRGRADYATLFTYLDDVLRDDQAMLEADRRSVLPGLVLILGAAELEGGGSWTEPHRRFVCRRGAPEVLAFGFGAAQKGIDDVATYPEGAFRSGDMDAVEAAAHFGAFLTRYVAECGRAAHDGVRLPGPTPTGFQPA